MHTQDEVPTWGRWHAPHPSNPKAPLCGTVGEDGRPTHRVSVRLTTTCKRCLKLKAAQEFAAKVLGPNAAIKPRRQASA
jgi:hypothetical protein